MPELISACLVFDDNESHLQRRLQQVNRALVRLSGDKVIEFAGDEPLGFTTRAEVLEHAVDSENALVIADMYSDIRGGSGNIGARVMRALAQHPERTGRTWRIMWSRHSVDAVTDAMAPYVHAFTAYDPSPDNPAALADAIRHGLGGHVQPRVFPAALPMDQWSDRLRVVLEKLVHEPMRGDERIAPMIKRGAPSAEINEELARIEGPHRPNVMSFVSAVRDNPDRPLASAEAAHEFILREMEPVAVHQISDGLLPAECDAALKHRPRLLSQTENFAGYLATTWLTAEEDELLHTFLYLYGPRVEDLHGGAENARYQAINEIIGTALDDPLPEWQAAKTRLGLDETDLSYALLTLADVRISR